MTDTRHLNQIDLSRRLGVSHRTLERWRWQGVGPAFLKIGGRVKYRLQDVESFERSRICRSTADEYRFSDQPEITA